MNPQKNEEIARQIQEILNQGLIKMSISPCSIPVVLVPKIGVNWRLCTDSRVINRIAIRYRSPILMIEDLMDYLSEAKYYGKIDLKIVYNQIRIDEGDEWKTNFKTNEGLYE